MKDETPNEGKPPELEHVEPADLGKLCVSLLKWTAVLATLFWTLRTWIWLPYCKEFVQEYNGHLIGACLVPFLFAKTLPAQGLLLFGAFFVALHEKQ